MTGETMQLMREARDLLAEAEQVPFRADLVGRFRLLCRRLLDELQRQTDPTSAAPSNPID